MSVMAEHSDDFDEIDLRELISRVWQGRTLIVVSVVIVTAAFAAAAFLMTPVYRATTMLAPVEADNSGALGSALGSVSGLASLAGIKLGSAGASQMEQALAVLRSREFTERFVTDLGLMPELYPKMWDVKAKAWNVSVHNQPTLAQACKYFDKLRTAAEDKKTGLVKVQMDWNDPQKAAYLANELVARLNSVMRIRAVQRTDAYIEYLEKELSSTTAIEARNAIGRLMESQINQRMLANVTEEFAFQVVDKALPPDQRDPVKPNKILLILVGVTTGLFTGIVIVLIRPALMPR